MLSQADSGAAGTGQLAEPRTFLEAVRVAEVRTWSWGSARLVGRLGRPSHLRVKMVVYDLYEVVLRLVCVRAR